MNTTKEKRKSITIPIGVNQLNQLRELALRQTVTLGRNVTYGDLIREAAATVYPVACGSTPDSTKYPTKFPKGE